jgi:hypothetical protein
MNSRNQLNVSERSQFLQHFRRNFPTAYGSADIVTLTFSKKYLQWLHETSPIRDSASEKVEGGASELWGALRKNEASNIWHSEGSFASLRISAAGYARKALQLADSRFSLYTTGFPIHSKSSRVLRSTRVVA